MTIPLFLRYKIEEPDYSNHDALKMEIYESVLNDYAYKLEDTLTAEILDKCERKLNKLGWYKQQEQESEQEPEDSIEKIKEDANKFIFQYWNCGDTECIDCPSKIDKKTPKDYYGTRGCLEAMKLDLIERTMKIMEDK